MITQAQVNIERRDGNPDALKYKRCQHPSGCNRHGVFQVGGKYNGWQYVSGGRRYCFQHSPWGWR